MREVVVAGAVRTPIGKFGGALAALTAAQLGAAAAREALAAERHRPRAGGRGDLRLRAAGRRRAQRGAPGRVPRRRAAGSARLHREHGLRQRPQGDRPRVPRRARRRRRDVVLAGGTESMSRVPYLLTGARWGYRMGDQAAVDGDVPGRLPVPARRAGHGRDRGDAWPSSTGSRARSRTRSRCAASSARRARWQDGRFDAEIVPVKAPGPRGEVDVSRGRAPARRHHAPPRWPSCRRSSRTTAGR